MVSFPTPFKKEPLIASPETSLEKLVVPTNSDTVDSGSENLSTDQNDWEIVDNGPRAKEKNVDPTSVGLNIHRLQHPDGVIVLIRSPTNAPAALGEMKRSPVDIVLVVDVSTSMEEHVECPEGPSDQSEPGDQLGGEPDSHHSVLDLVKNAAVAVIENLDERDRLGVVIFGYDAEVFQELTYMTCEAREALMTKVQTIQADGATNLWAGLRKGYQVLSSAGKRQSEKLQDSALSAIYLLTDGLPNVMPPAEGYVPALRKLIARETGNGSNLAVPSLHTFGFGYNLRSGLLQAMAEVGGGYFGFIPNGYFMATIFTHAIANLFTTFTTSATLSVTVSGSPQMLKPFEGAALCKAEGDTLEITLYNLQYGQTREVLLTWSESLDHTYHDSATISAALEYTGPGLASQNPSVVTDIANAASNLAPASMASYHVHRSMVCEFLASLSKPNASEEYIFITTSELDNALSRLDELIRKIQENTHEGSGDRDMLCDLGVGLEEAWLNAESPTGQVMQALFRPEFFNRWGKHYLPSLLHAYRTQLCLNEKDQGPKTFVAKNALFERFKEAQSESWNRAQDRLMEIVKEQARAGAANADMQRPSYAASRMHHPISRVSMAAYNNPNNPCFAGPSRILLTSGRRIPVRLVRRGASVLTPVGPRRVAAVVQTSSSSVALCKLGKLYITPWHPVLDTQSGKWIFPAMVADTCVRRRVEVYSVMLEQGYGPEAHSVNIGGHWCVTLGHGKVQRTAEDVRGHEFLRDYAKVMRELKRLPKGRDGLLRCGGMRRDSVTGLACGFEKPTKGHSHKMRQQR